MAKSKLVSIVGLEPLLKKLDDGLDIDDTMGKLLPDLGHLGASTLVERMPADWNRPRQVTLTATPDAVNIAIPRYPYIFFERGSQYPHGAGGRSKRVNSTRGNLVKSALRIKPRRFIARTRAIIRRELPNMVQQLQDAIEKEWRR